MNKNKKEKSMSRRTTPMNLNQRTNEKMRKTHRSVCDKSIQKSMQMRDGPNRMARNPEKELMNLGQLMRGDPRIRTPLDRSPSKI